MTIDPIDPRDSALLVIDMQNAFCHPDGTLGISGVDVSSAQATYAPIRRLAEAFGEAALPVIWTRQVHLDNDASRARKTLAPHTAKRKQVSALSGSWDAAFVDELADVITDPTFVVTKHRFGSFYETRLRPLLDMLGVERAVRQRGHRQRVRRDDTQRGLPSRLRRRRRDGRDRVGAPAVARDRGKQSGLSTSRNSRRARKCSLGWRRNGAQERRSCTTFCLRWVTSSEVSGST